VKTTALATFACLVLVPLCPAAEIAAEKPAQVTAPPAEFKVPPFYKKFVSADGYPIGASE
jgi:hypothetical protein